MNNRIGIAALAFAAGAFSVSAAEVGCASAESMDGLMRRWIAGFNAKQPEASARIALRAKFSADFVDPLARGQVQVAPFARELFPDERKRFARIAGGEPRMIAVATGSRATKGGTHAIVVFVHEKNPLARLSLPQLRRVFERDGAITTWGQLGLTGEWATRRIRVHGMRVRRETGNPPGIVNYLESRLLAGKEWRDDLVQHADIAGGPQALEQIVRAVAADEAAIGYSGFAYALPGAKALALGEAEAGPFLAGTEGEVARRQYPLSRTIYLCTGATPDSSVRAFINYVLGPEGQGLITGDAMGFLPVVAAPPEPPAELKGN